MSRLILLTTTASALTLFANPAFAQVNPPSATPASDDEIVVTGQKSYYDENAVTATRLDLPIVETPQSIFVINSDLIADQQAFRLDQVLQNDSSVQKSNNFLGAYSSYQIRGFTLSNTSNYLRDGRVFFHLAAPPVEVLERVEVLKGPSSVLYGTLAPGGIINMTPKRPQAEFEGSVKATIGTDSLYHGAIDFGGPLTNNGDVRYRLNGVYENSDFFREFSDGSDFNVKRYTLAGALDWDIGDKTLLRLNADYTDDNRPQDIGLFAPTAEILKQLNETLILSQPWSKYDSDVANFNAELTHDFSDALQFRTGFSFQDYRRDRYDNQFRGIPDAQGDVLFRARRRVNRYEYMTFFADVKAEFETGPLEHQVLVGVEKTDVSRDNNETAANFNFQTNIFNPPIIADPGIVTRPDNAVGGDDRIGIYAQDNIAFGNWRLLVGARYDDYEDEFFNEAGIQTFGNAAENLTPRVGLLYLPNPSLSLYGSYSESFEPNGSVGAQYVNAGDSLDPTIGSQWEAGVKWEAFGGTLLTTAAVFTIDRANVPIEDIISNTIVQRGKQTHNGAEITMAGIIGDHLSITGSATYLDAEFVEDDNPSIIGNTPNGVPELALSLAAEYEILEGTLDGLSIQGGMFYESDRPVDDANTYDLDAYTRFDAGLKYVQETANQDLIWRLTAQNIFDKRYYKGRSIAAIVPERPLEVRGSLEVKF